MIFIQDEDDCSTRDPQMFDTSQTSPSDPLGPLSSFRCFEFGVDKDDDDLIIVGGTQLAVVVERGGASVETGTHVQARCVTE